MALLREELATRGVQGSIPAPDDHTEIQDLDPQALLELQAMFGTLIQSNPQLVQLCNRTAPALFAALLFMVYQDFQIDPQDDDNVIAQASALEAEAGAIGMIRSVAAAFGKLEGTITVEPSDAEVDQDTELAAV